MATINLSSSLIILYFAILSLVAQSTLAPTYLAHDCPNTTTFTPNTQYESNLNTVLRSLSSNATASPTGFFTTSVGSTTNSNAVYGLFLCRGDQNVTSCSSCVSTAANTDLPKKYCRDRTSAIIWYRECIVRYSNETFFGDLRQDPTWTIYSSAKITENQSLFANVLGKTLGDLAVRAPNDKSGRMFATEVVKVVGNWTLYALGQCSQDLTESDCYLCLRMVISEISQTTLDATILQSSYCQVRYANFPFFNYAGAVNRVNKGKKKILTKVVISIVVPLSAISVALLLFMRHANKSAQKYHTFGIEAAITTIESLQYDLGTLQLATNNFSNENKLGEGGFGGVYKGTLANGQEIAVKRLAAHSSQGIQEFKNEVLLVAKLNHRNLVKLLGFCLTGHEKLLVYEYVPNKSLDYYVFDHEQQGLVDWRKRYDIIKGIARGMLYLHQDSRLNIIHRDLKASNILLDAELNPKISDFGLARMFSIDQLGANTNRIVGTYGYMSPEYAMRGQFSVKSDVYSFGVLVLEIVSGQRNSFYLSGEANDLVSYAWRLWQDGIPLEFVDPTILDSCSNREVIKSIQLGLLCVQRSPEIRPTMATVVRKLDSRSVTLPMPEQPGFFGRGTGIESQSQTISSINDVSISELEPR